MKAPFIQFYFEGRPVSLPLFAQFVWELPVVKAGKTPMLDLRTGKYNVDCAVCIDPRKRTAIVYNVTVETGAICFHEVQ